VSVTEVSSAPPPPTSYRPHPKVISATTVAALVTVGCWIASARGASIPTEVQGAITTALVGAAGYLTPSPS
jgi:hypothetical protein